MSGEIEIDRRTEQLIWRFMGRKSVRDMAKETGLTVEQVVGVRNRLLESVDELTLEQKRMKLLVDLEEIADKARRDYNSADDTDSGSKLLQVSVGAIKTVLEQLNRMEKNNTSRIDSLNALRVQELVDLIRETVDLSIAQISEEHGVDAQDLFDIFNRHLAEAAAKRDAL